MLAQKKGGENSSRQILLTGGKRKKEYRFWVDHRRDETERHYHLESIRKGRRPNVLIGARKKGIGCW